MSEKMNIYDRNATILNFEYFTSNTTGGEQPDIADKKSLLKNSCPEVLQYVNLLVNSTNLTGRYLFFWGFFYKNELLQKMKLKSKTYDSTLTTILCIDGGN